MAMQSRSAAATESACTPSALIEVFDYAELRLYDGHDHELRDPLQRFDRVCVLSTVPATDHEEALVIGIDEPDEVAKDYAMLVSQSGTRKDSSPHEDVSDMNRDSGRYQLRIPWCDGNWHIDAGA